MSVRVCHFVCLIIVYFSVSTNALSQTVRFTSPDTVCINTPVTINNTSTGATNYYWNFCVGNLNTAPTAINLGNISGKLSLPVFMDYIQVNGSWYGFTTQYTPGSLVRLDFGNSLLNTPTAVSLGDLGQLPYPYTTEGLQVVENEGRYYVIIVSGSDKVGIARKLIKVDFGSNITSTTPAVTNWGDVGTMEQPLDLFMFKDNNNWYGFVPNGESNTITRFSFTNSFNNTPAGVNMGNLGNSLAYPAGIFAINDNGFWRVFVVNGGDGQRIGTISTLVRLDFGPSLLNPSPTVVNLGNPGGMLHHPRDLTIMKMCGKIVGFAINGNPNYNDLVRMDFGTDLTSTPTLTSLGNIGNLDFPICITKLFRVNDNLYSFITNVGNNSITRLQFSGCTNSTISSSFLQNPPAVSYNTPGTYNINLTIDDGLSSQNSFCRQVVVMPALTPAPTQATTLCIGDSIKIGTKPSYTTYTWNTGATTDSIWIKTAGKYYVNVTNRAGCSSADTVNISTAPTPKINFNYTIPSCKSIQLAGASTYEPNPINHWNWHFGDNTTADAQTLPHSYTKGGSYLIKLLATDINGCKDSATRTIQLDTATALASYSGPACPGEIITLQGSGGTAYEWTPASYLNDPVAKNPTATITRNTRFSLKVTDALGCQDTTSILALAIEKPVFVKPADMQTCKGNSIVLNAKANNAYQYAWSPADYLNDPDTASPVAMPDLSTEYRVHITEPVCGYDTSFIVKTIVSANANVFVLANAFTPNGDGKNDCFGLRHWGNITVHTFTIYNRWGQKLFETKNPSQCWDGAYKGQQQAPGAYIYIIKALTPCGEIERKGSFMLTR